MGTTRQEWRSVSRQEPCPVCYHAGWCSISEDGTAVCCRRESDGPYGPGRPKVDRNGAEYWFHRIGAEGGSGASMAPQVSRRPARPLAARETISEIYSGLLERLDLLPRHLEDLQRRGLTLRQIHQEGFRSWPASAEEADEIAEDLYQEHGEDVFGVPGWWMDDEGRTRLCRRGSGWVIPTRDLEGRIVNFRIRLDEPFGDAKYLAVSSTRQGGPPYITAARLAMPSTLRQEGAVMVTEGEIKSLVAAERLGMPVISIPGVENGATALEWIRRLNARTVVIAFDSDISRNPNVRKAFLGLHSREKNILGRI